MDKLGEDKVEEGYIIKFLNLTSLDINKLEFIAKYGSVHTRRVAVDYMLGN